MNFTLKSLAALSLGLLVCFSVQATNYYDLQKAATDKNVSVVEFQRIFNELPEPLKANTAIQKILADGLAAKQPKAEEIKPVVEQPKTFVSVETQVEPVQPKVEEIQPVLNELAEVVKDAEFVATEQPKVEAPVKGMFSQALEQLTGKTAATVVTVGGLGLGCYKYSDKLAPVAKKVVNQFNKENGKALVKFGANAVETISPYVTKKTVGAVVGTAVVAGLVYKLVLKSEVTSDSDVKKDTNVEFPSK